MKLTTRSRYGTRMLLDIAVNGNNGPVRISDIADRQSISVKYLEKLIRELRLAGFIKSRRGPRGGHMLTIAPEAIRMGEVVRVLEGDEALVKCAADDSCCERAEGCHTRALWRDATLAVFERLNSFTLADLVEGGSCMLEC